MRRKLVLGGIAATLAVAAVGIGTQVASASETVRQAPAAAEPAAVPAAGSSDAAASVQHCVIVIGKASSGTTLSTEIYRYCSSTSRQDAQAHLQSAEARQIIGRPMAAGDLLMTWFADADYSGDSTDIYGYDGTCDAAGYRLEPKEWWQTHISSATGAGQCNKADFTSRSNKKDITTFKLPVPNLGKTLNDNVGLIQVYRAS